MALHSVLRMFDASDTWESYSRELEKYFEVNSVLNDNERVALLLTVLSPSVYKGVRDYCRPKSPRLKTYAELSDLLRIHHSPQPLMPKRIEFFSAMQAPTESVNDWHERVVKLAASCDFGDQLDTVVKDNFVSGLADRRFVCRLSEESSSVTLADLVVLAENYALLCSTDATILDLPDEVLRQIILLLTAGERVPLGNSCHRLRTLVFENPQLLRHLNFSKRAGLTTLAHIQSYFNSENACQHIRRVDASDVDCMKAGDLLNNSIGKAINLVEVNIHGTRFEDIWQLSSFLNLLQHLKKLSIDWPINDENDISLYRRILQRPFSRLTYLSVRLKKLAVTIFTSYLSLCQQLEELYMQARRRDNPRFCINSWNSEIKQLTNLKIVQYSGGKSIKFKEELTTVLPNPKRWTDFQLCGATKVVPHRFYIEKDVEVCEELLQSAKLQEFLNTAPWENFNLKWALDPKCLLKEVLRITHQDVPEDLCCLSTFERAPRHLLRVEEAKLLLKDPRYQISSLYMNHDLEIGCDTHLVASAFPNLSELVLSRVKSNFGTAPKDSHFQRRLSRRGNPAPEKQDESPNLDSSFKMLVENTPNLRHFTLDPPFWPDVRDWDLGALCLISRWQNLETLHMSKVPWEDGKFLIEIGKQCKNLQVLSLSNNCWERRTGSAQVAILQMLEHCRNLRKLTLEQFHLDQSKMFASLAKNVKLERVDAINYGTKHSAAPWISSLEKLIRQCVKLTTIICEANFKTEDDLDEAESAVNRIREECHRPDFQMQVTCYCGD